MTNVTLVMPRFKYAAGDFSLGLASIASYLKQSLKDVQVHAVDATFDPDMEHIAEQLRQHPADITGIFMDTLMYRDALAVARIAKKHSPFVIVGGPHPSILPETVISDDSVDAVCIGEGEQTFSELVSSRKEGKSLEGVKGLWFKSDGAVVKNERRMPIEDIDTLPLPDIEIFDVERYIANFIQLDSYSPNLRGMSVIVSRGCPFGCSYCQPVLDTIFGKRFRIRSPRKTVEDLKYLKQKYRLDGVYFQDDTLTVSRKWMAEFCALAVSERLDMVWACNTRADWGSMDLLPAMKRAGLVKIKFGIESICDRIRNGIYQKGIAKEQIYHLIDAATKEGIQVTGFFMLGAPGERLREILKTIRFAANSRLTEANFSVCVPLPKTSLHEMVKREGAVLSENYADYDYYHAVRPTVAQGDVSSKWLERLKKLAYLSFYFHPRRALHTLSIICGRTGFRKLLQKLKRF